MKKLIFTFLCSAGLLGLAHAQKTEITAPSNKINLKKDATVTVLNTVSIKGQAVPYKAIAGTEPVTDAEGQAIAEVFYTYYERTDVKDKQAVP